MICGKNAIIPLDDQHSVLQRMGQQMTSNYMMVSPGVTFKPSKMSIDQPEINQLQIIIHAVNQSWTVYDPNAEPTTRHGR